VCEGVYSDKCLGFVGKVSVFRVRCLVFVV
jgi:hypothetical protein